MIGDPTATKKDPRVPVPGWVSRGRFLVRTEIFRDFAAAMVRVVRVAELSERLDHHPDIEIRWNRVTLRLTTHEVGAVTEKDRKWARADALENRTTPSPERKVGRRKA
ncbi:MAG: hypothetical protein RIT19_97 [Verrucomicrobiota bacterium]|jgi:4a-hydroxytetrahydrobiopterin dehydratase